MTDTRSNGARREDLRFLTGAGRYTGDLLRDGMLFAQMVRSPHGHAAIRDLDFSAALAVPGVVACYGPADLAAAGVGPEPGGISYPLADGSPAPKTDRPALADRRALYAGEALAIVVASTRAAARDGAEAVAVDLDPLPAITTVGAALDPAAPQLWPGAPGNVGYVWRGGDASATRTALAGAAHVTRLCSRVSRVSACAMENRLFLAEIDPEGRLVMHASHQAPHRLRDARRRAGFPTPGPKSVMSAGLSG